MTVSVPCAEKPDTQPQVRIYVRVCILRICTSLPSWIWKDVECALPQSAQWSAVWEAAWCPWHYLFYLHSRLCSLGGQCVPKIKQWCYRNLTNSLWEQSSSALLSIHTKPEAREMMQWAHRHLNLVEEEVEGREVIEKTLSCAHKLTPGSIPMSFLQITSPNICASTLHVKVLHNLTPAAVTSPLPLVAYIYLFHIRKLKPHSSVNLHLIKKMIFEIHFKTGQWKTGRNNVIQSRIIF